MQGCPLDCVPVLAGVLLDPSLQSLQGDIWLPFQFDFDLFLEPLSLLRSGVMMDGQQAES